MRHQHHQPPTVAILGTNSLIDRILARLLKDEGYDTELLDAYPTGHSDNLLLDGVDVLVLSPPYLDPDVRGAFLAVMRRTPEGAQRIPGLSLSLPLQMAVQDELAVSVSWQSLFEELVQAIEDALAGAEASTRVLPVDAGEPLKGFPHRSEVA